MDVRLHTCLQVPCSGTVQTGILTYNYNSEIGCGAAEQFSWRQFAENRAREVRALAELLFPPLCVRTRARPRKAPGHGHTLCARHATTLGLLARGLAL